MQEMKKIPPNVVPTTRSPKNSRATRAYRGMAPPYATPKKRATTKSDTAVPAYR